MKKFSLYLMTLVALIGAGVAYAAASPNAKLQKQDRLYGGGQFGPGCFSNSTLCFANSRNFSVDAHAEGGGVDAVGNFNYGAPGSALDDSDRVTCLQIEGNRAAIGGITDDGLGFVWYAVDRGGPANGDRDLASPEYIDNLNAAVWPVGFPNVCPSPVTGAQGLEPIYQEVHYGDIVVVDAPSG
jgi:hypothetical protein